MAAYLITGDDESLVLSAVGELVRSLVGDGDRTLMVDDFDGDYVEVRAIIDAAQTPPFLTDQRVVIATASESVAPFASVESTVSVSAPLKSALPWY